VTIKSLYPGVGNLGCDQPVTDGRSLWLESMTNPRVTPHGKPTTGRKTGFSARNGLTPDGPWDASAQYEPAGPISCPRSGGSAGGRRKHRPPRSRYSFDNLDRLPGWLPKASDRWLRFGPPRRRPRPVETFRSFRPTKLPGRPLPRPAARSRLPGGERRLPDRPDGGSIQPRPSPQADPLRIGPQNLLLLRLRVPPLGLQDPIGLSEGGCPSRYITYNDHRLSGSG